MQALEEEVSLSHANFVLAFLSKIFTRFNFKMFFILALSFADVVLEGLLFDLHFDVLFLFSRQVFIGNITCFTLFFEVAGVFERSGPFEVSFECTIHVWKFAFHAGVPMIFDSVVCTAFKDFGYFSPLVIDDPMHKEENPLFLLAPVNLLDHWV